MTPIAVVAPVTAAVPEVHDPAVSTPPPMLPVVPVNVCDSPSSVFVCATVHAMGVAGDAVLLHWTELAAKFACLARVTAPAAIVVAADPALLVTSPVSAGNAVAGSPLAFVSTSAVGVPSAGVTKVGDIASTVDPVPVAAAQLVVHPDDVMTPVRVGSVAHCTEIFD